MEHLSCDVLIVGSGAAGLRAAVSVREQGVDALVISKAKPGKATCTYSSGGVFAGTPEGESTETHLAATLQAGRGVNQRELVEVLVGDAPHRLRELVDWGMKGDFHRGFLYAHGRPQVWGGEIVRCLLARNRALGTRCQDGLIMAGLEIEEGAAAALAYSLSSARWLAVSAKAVVFATGGAAALYLRHDNPRRMVGDGYSLLLETGALLQNMEFVQFYPLTLGEPGLPPLLIPPRLAAFGRLVLNSGEEILAKYGIEEQPAAEKARDRLAQAMFNEIHRNGEEVWLDLREVSEEQWRADPLSASVRNLLGERCGGFSRPIRVAPAAHHTMGGVRIDPAGATSVPGLFAAGEVTGGLHGANRMGGNALAETVVFGARAGESAALWAKSRSPARSEALARDLREPGAGSATAGRGPEPARVLRRLREVLWREGGIIRSGEGLSLALAEVMTIMGEVRRHGLGDGPRQIQDGLELRCALQTAALILEAGLKREESRGAHFREDFPAQDDSHWHGIIQVRLSPDREPVWTFQGA